MGKNVTIDLLHGSSCYFSDSGIWLFISLYLIPFIHCSALFAYAKSLLAVITVLCKDSLPKSKYSQPSLYEYLYEYIQ